MENFGRILLHFCHQNLTGLALQLKMSFAHQDLTGLSVQLRTSFAALLSPGFDWICTAI